MPSGVKNMPSKPEIPLRPYFRPLRARIGLNIRFYVLFLISDKNKEFDMSQEALNLFISKIKIFYPLFTVLPAFTKLGVVSKQTVGEKNSVIFGFKIKSYTL